MHDSLAAGHARDARARRHLRRRRRRAARRRRDLPARAAATSTRWCWSTPTRSAPRSRTSSRTPARSPSRPARSPSRASSATSRASGWQARRWWRINCGANVNFDRLRHIAERADLGAEREALLAVEIPEQPGSFLRFCQVHRPAQRHRVQLPLLGGGPGADLRRARPGRRPRGNGSRCCARSARPATGGRHDRQRDGEAARALHGRRARAITRARATASASSFRSAPARCCASSRRSGRAGTSACSTTATTAPTTAACWPACRCRRPSAEDFALHLRELHYPYVDETANPAYRMFLGS